MARKVQTGVYFTVEQRKAIQRIVARESLTMAHMVREAMQRVIDYYDERTDKLLVRAERLAGDVLSRASVDNAETIQLAHTLQRLADRYRQIHRECLEATQRASQQNRNLLELQGRIEEMLARPKAAE